MKSLCAFAALILLRASSYGQASSTLTIDPRVIVSPASPTLYGLMTEEINYSYDGGLYAEIIRNRTFLHTWGDFER